MRLTMATQRLRVIMASNPAQNRRVLRPKESPLAILEVPMKSRLLLQISSLLVMSVLLGCGASETKMGVPQVAGGPFTFVANNNLDSISTFRTDAGSGQMSMVGTTSTGACSGPRYLELHPNKIFLFA